MYVSEIQYGGCMHMEEALAVENWVKSVKFCLYSTKTRCYGGVQQAHPMKSTENFDFNLQKARIFSSEARITREDFKPYWTTDRGKCFNPNCFRLFSGRF